MGLTCDMSTAYQLRYSLPMRSVLVLFALSPLIAQNIGIDSHIDTVQRIFVDRADITQRSPVGHVDIPRLKEGGVNAPFFALWVPTYYPGAEAVRRTLDLRDAMQRLLDTHPEQIALALTGADIERITKSGRIAVILTVEGGHQIDDDLAVLRIYHRLGIRSMTLSHFRNNSWADSSTDEPAHNGLTAFGKEVVKEMNRLGMIVDVSHVSDKTFYDALEVSSKPVIASHSSCRAISDVPRNMTDDMLRALAKNGGVVHINFFEGFLDSDFAQRFAALKDEQAEQDAAEAQAPKFGDRSRLGPAGRQIEARRTAKLGRIPLSRLLDHIDHAVQVAGIDHVGLGSDFDGASGQFPEGVEDISGIPNLVRGLMARGYSDQSILKILGSNTLRVMRQVERVSHTTPPR